MKITAKRPTPKEMFEVFKKLSEADQKTFLIFAAEFEKMQKRPR